MTPPNAPSKRCQDRPSGRPTVDRDSRAHRVQGRALRQAFPNVTVAPLVADFAMPLDLPLDGIVMRTCSTSSATDSPSFARRELPSPGRSPDPRVATGKIPSTCRSSRVGTDPRGASQNAYF
jgi:hypothetical protein